MLLTATSLAMATPAHAQPAAAPGGGASITGIEQINDRWVKISVFSTTSTLARISRRAPRAGSG
jgi:diacylglycerol O-acyltransferase / trehalose O-mycolyltransferase